MSIACVNGSKTNDAYNMDDLEIYWMSEFILFTIWFSKVTKKQKIIALVIILSIPCIRGPFICIGLVLLTIITYGYVNFSKFAIKYLLNTCLTPIFTGYKLPKKSTIFICNYPTNFVEYLFNHILDKKICFVTLSSVIVQSSAVKIFYDKNSIIFTSKNCSFEDTQNMIKKKLDEGYNIYTYVEKDYYKRPNKYSINELRSGMFNIAKNLNTTITPVVFDHINHYGGILQHNHLKIYIDNTRLISDVDMEIKNVSQLFNRKLKTFKIK